MFRTDAAGNWIDETLAARFRASDAPASNPRRATLVPRLARKPVAVGDSSPRATGDLTRDDVLDVSWPSGSGRTFGHGLAALLGAAALAVLVTLAFVVAGTLVDVTARAVFGLVQRLLALAG